MLNSWQGGLGAASDLSKEVHDELQAMYKRLQELLPDPIRLTEEEIGNLTEDQANLVMYAARRTLLVHLFAQEFHQHMGDDCGDYLAAATSGWQAVFEDAWMNDFQGYTDHITTYLTDLDRYPVGGCDGEVRISIVPNFDGFEED
jgi:hypothetical protein